jgi:hypothetical protein
MTRQAIGAAPRREEILNEESSPRRVRPAADRNAGKWYFSSSVEVQSADACAPHIREIREIRGYSVDDSTIRRSFNVRPSQHIRGICAIRGSLFSKLVSIRGCIFLHMSAFEPARGRQRDSCDQLREFGIALKLFFWW